MLKQENGPTKRTAMTHVTNVTQTDSPSSFVVVWTWIRQNSDLRDGDPAVQFLGGLEEHLDDLDGSLHAGEVQWRTHLLVTAAQVRAALDQHAANLHLIVRRRQVQRRHLLLVHRLRRKETKHCKTMVAPDNLR